MLLLRLPRGITSRRGPASPYLGIGLPAIMFREDAEMEGLVLSESAVAAWLDVTVMLGAVALVTAAFRHISLNPILGLLAVGAVLGGNGFGLLGESDGIAFLAELGVMFLLFKVGLELSMERLRLLARWIFGLGSVHFVASVGLLTFAVGFLGFGWKASFAIAVALALSSTAFVLQILSERHELNSRHGRKSFSVLLLQDIVVAPVLALIPLLGAKVTSGTPHVEIVPAIVAMGVVFIVSRLALLAILGAVRDSAHTDAFPAAIIFVALAMGLVAKHLGLSPSLGAFLAGLALSDAHWRGEVKLIVQPFQSMLLGFFFINVGAAFPLDSGYAEIVEILACALGLLLLKGLAGLLACFINGVAWRDGIRVSASLAQGGEFSFVVLASAAASGILAPDDAAFWTAVAVVSMALTPALIGLSARAARDGDPQERQAG
jgi:CPA2 family monovalent cation:H+ antiporter-2